MANFFGDKNKQSNEIFGYDYRFGQEDKDRLIKINRERIIAKHEAQYSKGCFAVAIIFAGVPSVILSLLVFYFLI